MNERKNIDRLFQEKFKDFEATPPEKVWKDIEFRLREEKDDRKVIPFWFQLSGIAAALLIGLLLTDGFTDLDFNRTINNNNSVTIEQTAPVFEQGRENDALRETVATNEIDGMDLEANANNKTEASTDGTQGKGLRAVQRKNRIANTNSENDQGVGNTDEFSTRKNTDRSLKSNRDDISNSPGSSHISKEGLAENLIMAKAKSEKNRNATGSQSGSEQGNNSNTRQDSQLFQNLEQVAETNQIAIANAQNTSIKKDTLNVTPIDSTAIATVAPNTLEELLNEKENNVTTNEPKVNRWQVSSNVAPIYFSSTSNGSPIDPSLANNSKDYKQNLGFGLGVRYAINKKMTVRTGVNTIGLEYNTKDVVFYQNTNARQLENVSTNLQGSAIQIESKNANQMPELFLTKFDGNLNQKTGYIEIPLELSYKILEGKKFGFEVIGGMSTLFLNENEISMISAGTEMPIGKANNLNSTHFSTNFGVGLKYNIFQSFQFNVEPMIKYQINTFSDSGNFQPFIFGVYTGVNYRF